MTPRSVPENPAAIGRPGENWSSTRAIGTVAAVTMPTGAAAGRLQDDGARCPLQMTLPSPAAVGMLNDVTELDARTRLSRVLDLARLRDGGEASGPAECVICSRYSSTRGRHRATGNSRWPRVVGGWSAPVVVSSGPSAVLFAWGRREP